MSLIPDADVSQMDPKLSLGVPEWILRACDDADVPRLRKKSYRVPTSKIVSSFSFVAELEGSLETRLLEMIQGFEENSTFRH